MNLWDNIVILPTDPIRIPLRERKRLRRKGQDSILFPQLIMFDPMADLAGNTTPQEGEAAATPKPPAGSAGSGNGDRQFGKELHSITIRAKQRTFYIDLKESSNGKFFKVSEKSRGGRKTTIMFDSEDLGAFIDAFNEMKGKL